MAQAKMTDNYANFGILTTVESAANTLTFKKMESSVGMFERIGWLISRVDWYFRGGYALFNSTADILEYGLCQSNSITDLSAASTQMLLSKTLYRVDLGTAASGTFQFDPIVEDLSTLPGGGMLVIPNPLYLAVKGTGLSGAATVTARIWYRGVTLSDADYFDLMQSRQVLNS